MQDIIGMLKEDGLRVFVRKQGAEYCFVTDGANIAYVQWSDYRPSVSTVHTPNKTTGTGFGMFDEITIRNVREAMVTVAPEWALRDRGSVTKYKNWDSFHNANSFNKELFEI